MLPLPLKKQKQQNNIFKHLSYTITVLRLRSKSRHNRFYCEIIKRRFKHIGTAESFGFFRQNMIKTNLFGYILEIQKSEAI